MLLELASEYREMQVADLANAVYDAVDARVFQLPITPARVKEALAARYDMKIS